MSFFMDIAGIAGESQSPNPDWNAKIELHSMSYGVHQKATSGMGGGLLSQGSEFGAMHLTKSMDKSTPMLFGLLAKGDPTATVTLRVSRAGASTSGLWAGLYEAETYTLHEVRFMSYHTSGTPGPGGLPLESWTLAFTGVVEKYVTLDKTGNLKSPQSAGYSVAQAKAIAS